jgi:polysaccharide pyruvyl transferase WcaK-like protein
MGGGIFMRILLDPGILDSRNKGNLALLQVAMNRLYKFWPTAYFEVLSITPHILKYYFPKIHPIRPNGQEDRWNDNTVRYFNRCVPRIIMRILLELREEIWWRWPEITPGQMRKKLILMFSRAGRVEESEFDNKENKNNGDLEKEIKLASKNMFISGFDLYVAIGAQYMSDACKDQALAVLNRIEIAYRHKIPTIMVGQGFGPIENQQLQTRCREVLPNVELIFVREKRSGPQLLASFGVDLNRVFFTGDDAIELAYEVRPQTLGTGIGVGWRIGSNTELKNPEYETFRKVLHESASIYGAELIALPISNSAYELDGKFINSLLEGYKRTKISPWRFGTPIDTIKMVGKCRVVISGTFHPIVFALAQGIPAIGLAKSKLYMDKFLGLAEQFRSGFWFINLEEEQVEQKLRSAIDDAWMNSTQIRPLLLEVAARQILSGNTAYRRINELFTINNQVRTVE